jgi:membrane associated rhomboid family serine protease
VTTPAIGPLDAAPDPRRPDGPARERRWFEVTSWSGALIAMTALCGVLWIIEIVNQAGDFDLQQYGLRPRDLDGLVGVVTAPFLHAGYGHLLANTAPFILIGWFVLVSGVRQFLLASAIIIVVGDLATWLIAPSGIVVGASGLILGWLGYLLGRAYFSRRIVWIIAAVGVVFFFGTLLGGLLPSVNSEISWQGHLAGFLAGVLAAWILHQRLPARSSARSSGGSPRPSPFGERFGTDPLS